MDMNRLTEKSQEALAAAQRQASRRSHQQVDVEHLLLALVEQEQGLAAPIFQKAGANIEALKRRSEQELERLPRVTGASSSPDQIYVTGRLNRLLDQTEDEAKRLKDEYVSIEHLLLAMTGTQYIGGVAWWAHVGGFVAGMVLLPFFKKSKEDYRDNYPDEYRPW